MVQDGFIKRLTLNFEMANSP